MVGSPAKHSLSPLIHGAWLQAAGIDGEYGLYDIAPEGFRDFLHGALARGLSGVNVTIPFKEEALAAAVIQSPRATAAGAANLLLFRGGRVEADNTDGLGLLHALDHQAGFQPAGAVVVLLGAGGAARGAAAALVEAGAAEIRIVNRTRSRADDIARLLGERVLAFDQADVEQAMGGASLLINATSLGLNGENDLDLPLGLLPRESVVMDMVYRPLETGLLQQARAYGHTAVDGLEMLIGQAIPAFEALFGAPPPPIDVRSLALEKLRS